MSSLSRRSAIALLAGAALGRPAQATPIRYRLDPAGSSVGFVFDLNGTPHHGTMPVRRADITVDPDDLGAARVDVTLDAAGAQTTLTLATEALKGASVLNAAAFPDIRFVSTAVQLAQDGRLSGGATLRGRVTVRDVTRDLTLSVDIFRPHGSAPDDLSRLTAHLTGQISRAAFGATGYPDLVGDIVVLDITAAIEATG